MDKETLEALKGSIKKWEEIVEGTSPDNGIEDCLLCHLFNEKYKNHFVGIIECKGCIISEKVGNSGCEDTPYEFWYEYIFSRDMCMVFDEESKQLATDELEFLKSLLPKDES